MALDLQPNAPGASSVQKVHGNGNIGSIPKFESHWKWDVHQERLQQYFVANKIEPERQVAVLFR